MIDVENNLEIKAKLSLDGKSMNKWFLVCLVLAIFIGCAGQENGIDGFNGYRWNTKISDVLRNVPDNRLGSPSCYEGFVDHQNDSDYYYYSQCNLRENPEDLFLEDIEITEIKYEYLCEEREFNCRLRAGLYKLGTFSTETTLERYKYLSAKISDKYKTSASSIGSDENNRYQENLFPIGNNIDIYLRSEHPRKWDGIDSDRPNFIIDKDSMSLEIYYVNKNIMGVIDKFIENKKVNIRI